jgi:threonine dehydrogenase-like Zn-dependent dehydrogenase
MGKGKVELTTSLILSFNPHDAIITLTRTAICGSGLHLYDGFIPTMEEGDILGMSSWASSKRLEKKLQISRGDRVVYRLRSLRAMRVLPEEDCGRLRKHQSNDILMEAHTATRVGLDRLFPHDGRYAGGSAICGVHCEYRHIKIENDFG